MPIQPLDINDIPIQNNNESSNHGQFMDDTFSEKHNNEILNSPNNQDNEEDFEYNLASPYNNDSNIDSSINYNNIELSKNSKELTKSNGINKKGENNIDPSPIKSIVENLTSIKRIEGKQNSNEINDISTNFIIKKKKISTGRKKKKKFTTKNITKSKFIVEKINESKKTMHTKNSVDNTKKKVFPHVMQIIHNLIEKKANKYIDKNDKLYDPYINRLMGNKRDSDLKNVSKFHIYKIYYESTGPKNPKSHYSKDQTKLLLDKIKEKEEEDPNAKIKILNIIFKKTLREFILIYLNDNPFLNHYEGILEEPIDLCDYDNEFKTYKDDMNDLDPLIKEETKNKLINLLELK